MRDCSWLPSGFHAAKAALVLLCCKEEKQGGGLVSPDCMEGELWQREILQGRMSLEVMTK